MPYNAGDAYLRIIPVFTGISNTINAEAKKWGTSAGKSFAEGFNSTAKSETSDTTVGPSDSRTTKQGGETGGRFADAFKARVAAALRDMPNVDIDANTDEADRKLAELRARLVELSGKNIGVDISAAEAEAKLEAIRAELDQLGARSPNVRVQVDAAAASAELAAFEAEVQAVDGSSIDIPVDTGGLNAGAGSVALLTSAIIGLISLVGPATAGLAAIGAAAASTIGALASGAGVATLGFLGVSNAVNLLGQREKAMQSAVGGGTRAMGAQANQAGQLKQAETALANARAAADDAAIQSAERVKSARQSLADAVKAADRQQVQSAEDVQRAEENLARAVQNSTQAQQELNDAREQAVRDLEDYANRAVDSNLNLQQSQIDLTEAAQQYQQDKANPKVSALQLQQDALNVAKAQQSLVEAQQQAAQAAADNADAQQKGVDGAPGVVRAEQNITTALQAQKQATQDLADARQKAADDTVASQEKIKNAQQAVSDAVRQQAAQQRQSAASVQSAMDRVTQAMQGVGGAATAAGGAGNIALARIDDQLAKVSPNVLKLAEAIRSKVIPAFHDLEGAAATGLAPGLLAGGATLSGLLPGLKTYVTNTGKILGGLFQQMATDLAGPFWTQFFGFISKNTGPMLKTFGDISKNVFKGFAGILEAMQPITDAIGGAIDEWSKDFERFGTGPGIKQFVDYLKKNGPIIAQFFGGLLGLAGRIIDAFAPLGLVIMQITNVITGFLNSISPAALLGIIAGVGAVIAGVGIAIGIAFGGIVGAALAAPAVIVGAVLAIMAGIALLVKYWSQIWDFLKSLWLVFVAYIKERWAAFGDFVSGAWKTITSIPGKLWHAIWDTLKADWNIFKAWITPAWDALKTTAKADWELIKTYILNPIKAAYEWVTGTFGKIGKFFKDLWTTVKNDTKQILGSMGTAAKSAFDGVVSWVKGALNGVIDAINFVIRALDSISFTMPKWVDKLFPGLGGQTFGIHIPVIPHLANGGVLDGYAPGMDSILTMLSPGEGVLVPEAVRGLGGAAGVNAINRSFAPRVPHLADGGVLGATLAAASSSGGSVTSRIVAATVAALAMLGEDKNAPVVQGLRDVESAVRESAVANAAMVGSSMRDTERMRQAALRSSFGRVGIA